MIEGDPIAHGQRFLNGALLGSCKLVGPFADGLFGTVGIDPIDAGHVCHNDRSAPLDIGFTAENALVPALVGVPVPHFPTLAILRSPDAGHTPA